MSEIVAFAVGLLVAAAATALLSRRRERARRREMAAARAWLGSLPVPEGTPLGEDDITEPEPAVVRGREATPTKGENHPQSRGKAVRT